MIKPSVDGSSNFSNYFKNDDFDAPEDEENQI